MLHVMPDTTELEALIARLVSDRTLLQRGEAATRQAAVNPTLRALGWNTDNLDEVDPEFADSDGGKVDYCLRHRGKDLVLIEVKRASADLAQHQEQLLRYAFGLGVELAALTNGLEWWLYLPMKGGRSFEGRRFASIDFRGQDTGEGAIALNRFLNRDACIDGVTLREAEAEFDRQERDQQVRTVLPEAWSRVLGDSRFHDLFARVVEEASGHLPNRETLGAFLRGMPGGEAVVTDRPAQPEPTQAGDAPDDVPPVTTTAPTPTVSLTRSRTLFFWLDGARHAVESWRALLPTLCERLARQGGPEFIGRALGVTNAKGRKRAYFSLQPSDLNTPVKIASVNLYVEGRVNANQAEHIARRLLGAVRGSDDGFRIEVGDVPSIPELQPQPHRSAEPAQDSPRAAPADLVVALLEEVGTPLHYREIERRLRESGKFEAGGRDPANTLLGRFFNDPRLHRTGRGTYALFTTGEASPAPTPQESVTTPPAAPETPDRATFAGRRLAAFWLDGIRHEVGSWPLMVRTLSEQLMDEAGPTFDERVATVRGRTRRYFSNRPDDLTHPRALANSNLHVEGNLGPDAAVRVARQTLTAVRGSDDGFRIELAE